MNEWMSIWCVILSCRFWLTGSMMFWWGRGSLSRIWLKICMMDRFCKNFLVRRSMSVRNLRYCHCTVAVQRAWTVLTWNAEWNVFPPASCAAEKLEGEKLNVAEVTQSEIAQKQKLQTVLERINDSLKLSTRNIRWNVDCENLPLLLLFISLVAWWATYQAIIFNLFKATSSFLFLYLPLNEKSKY